MLAFDYPKTEWVVKQGLWPKFGHCSMCLQLRPAQDGERTRLLYRVRLSAPPLGRALMAAFFEPTDFIQSRKMLTGIKRRAETHHASALAAQAHKTKTGGRAR